MTVFLVLCTSVHYNLIHNGAVSIKTPLFLPKLENVDEFWLLLLLLPASRGLHHHSSITTIVMCYPGAG